MTLNLPTHLTYSHVKKILEIWQHILESNGTQYSFNASQLKFVDPFGICLFAAILNITKQKGKDINLLNIPPDINSYLSRMDFFKNCNIPQKNTNRKDLSNSLTELKCLDNARAVNDQAKQLAVATIGSIASLDLDDQPDDMSGYKPSEQLVIPLQYIFAELLENSLTHGRRSGFNQANVWIASQYYKKDDIIRLAIVDNGCGFLRSLSKHPQLSESTHLKAINIALQPRITCNPEFNLLTEYCNQGIGLTATKEIIGASNGLLSLASGDAIVEITGNDGHYKQTTKAIPFWQGVIVYAELRRAQLGKVNISKIINSIAPTEETPLRFE